MWNISYDIFDKHAILKKLFASSRFYNAKMNENEKFPYLGTLIRQIDATINSMRSLSKALTG